MSKNAAGEDKLGELHSKIADVYLRVLEGYDVLAQKQRERIEDPEKDEPEVVLEPSAAFLSAVNAFLKNNEITCNTENSETLSKLQNRLSQKGRVTDGTASERKVVPLRDLPVREEDDPKPVQGEAELLDKLGLG